MTLGPDTALYTLIGDPVGHSLSPLIHNTAFDAISEDAVYVATRVEASALADAMRGLAVLGFRGVNVTIPHKLAIMEHLGEVSETARAIGAVNAVRIDRSEGDVRLIGDNTDAAGFAGPLLSDSTLSPRSALVLGAGGASRAVVYACLELVGMTEVAVSARREEQAAGLVEGFRGGLSVVGWEDRSAAASRADLIINCTPLGMHPAVDRSPLDDLSGIGSDHTVYDLVYAPAETRLLKDAAAQGARTIPGVEMLIGQAAAAFRWWTGRDMPVAAVRTALRRRMEGS